MTALHIGLSIPKQTTIDNPTKYEFNVSPMLIQRVSIGFPLGCVDLVGIWMEYRSARLYPSNDDGYFVGNGQIIEFVANTYITQPPFFIAVKGYNEDSVFAHRIWINLDVEFINVERPIVSLQAADNANFPHNRA